MNAVDRGKILEMASQRAPQVRAFLEWAADTERDGAWLRMSNRPDIKRAAEAASWFAEPWWGHVVYSCFDALPGARAVAAEFREPLDSDHAVMVVDTIDFPRGSVGGHRIQPAVKGAKTALVSACDRAGTFREILYWPEPFDALYRRLRAERIPQWGRTTCFDLLLRAGALGVGGSVCKPELAYLDGSTGPKKGFEKIWDVALTPETCEWGESVLRAWTDNWSEVASNVGAAWVSEPFEPADFENALCIWQEHRYD